MFTWLTIIAFCLWCYFSPELLYAAYREYRWPRSLQFYAATS